MGTNNLNPQRLAEKLKQIRLKRKLSQNQLLQKMGYENVLFQGNISQYELGRREPPLIVLLSYARLAEVSVDILIDDNADLP